MSRNWQPCRVCGADHTNPQSSSICPACGATEAAALTPDAYTDADRFRDPVDVAFEHLSQLAGWEQADAVKALIAVLIEEERRR